MAEEEIGEVTHYFDKVEVAVLKLKGSLKVGDTIHVKGPATDFEQSIDSMQIERKPIEEAKPGDDIGLKVKGPVKKGDKVFLVV